MTPSTHVAVIDAGIGNTRSCVRMLEYLDIPVELVAEPEGLDRATHALLPGVGHFDHAMQRLRAGGWIDPIKAYAASGRPLLGICLGMQLLGAGSAEGDEAGFGFLPWSCLPLPVSIGIRVPHMGWNVVQATDDSLLHSGEDERFYFVHGYYVPGEAQGVSATCSYGVDVAATVESGNVMGVQFHPEKSHRFGMGLLSRFAEVRS